MILDEMALRKLVREVVFEAVPEIVRQLRGESGALSSRDPDDGFLTVKRAAEFASVGVSTIRQWLREGRLPRHGNGRLVRIRRPDLVALLSAPEPSSTTLSDEEADRMAVAILARDREDR